MESTFLIRTDCGDDEGHQTIVDEDAISNLQHLHDVLVVYVHYFIITSLQECFVGSQLEGLTLRQLDFSGPALKRQ